MITKLFFFVISEEASTSWSAGSFQAFQLSIIFVRKAGAHLSGAPGSSLALSKDNYTRIEKLGSGKHYSSEANW
jgi:hypothetical protein